MNPTPQSNDGSWSVKDDHGSGTSIFDPVICELAYRWFSPTGGRVLDPFAGGSVRGVVAGRLGREYVGIDLSDTQVEANRVQWSRIGGKSTSHRPVTAILPSIVVESITVGTKTIRVVRDDLLPGGTKRRVLREWLPRLTAETGKRRFVYAGPAYGFAQVALALACRDTGLEAVVLVPERKELHSRSMAARDAGATVIQVPFGRLSVLEARAREYATEHGAVLLPFGMDSREFMSGLIEVVRNSGEEPSEVWCVAGSGVLSRALGEAWAEAHVNAVRVGTSRAVVPDRATVYEATEPFEDDAVEPPPFPSCSNYDAKAWQFIVKHARDGALFWNVAADGMVDPPPEELYGSSSDTVSWYVGDSRDVLPTLVGQEFDLLFSCPPYADLERYSDDPRDLSTMDYDRFIEEYSKIIQMSCSMLREDRFACFVVGDLRDRQTGHYRSFPADTIRAFHSAGLELYNDAVLVTSVGSLPIRVGYQFANSRKLGKTHQNVLVFVKGDPRRASFECGEVDVSDLDMPDCVVGAVALCVRDVASTVACEYLSDGDVSIVELPELESYLLCDVVRGEARDESRPIPRAWIGTESGWKALQDKDELTYLINGVPYLSVDLFPNTKRPPDIRSEVRRLRGS
jgi:hypothetical protein